MMDLGDVYAEIETKLKAGAGMSGVHVVKWGQKPTVPGAMLLLPSSVVRGSYRGMWVVRDVALLIISGRADTRNALGRILDLAIAARNAIDPASWTTCADVTVTETSFDTITIAGAQDAFLGALLHLDITGTGA
jgi:hypothetical protein